MTDAIVERHIKNTIVALLGRDGDEWDDVLARLVNDVLIDLTQTAGVTGLTRANIAKRVRDPADDFPRPIKIDRRELWLLSEVRPWIRARVRHYREQPTIA